MNFPDVNLWGAAKALGLLTLGVLLLGILDLYTLQLVMSDPGYYVVARRSDTPDQVLDALSRLRQRNFDDVNKIRTLIRRYHRKLNNQDSTNTQKWKQARREAFRLLHQVSREVHRDTSSAR